MTNTQQNNPVDEDKAQSKTPGRQYYATDPYGDFIHGGLFDVYHGGITINWILRVIRRKFIYILLGIILGLSLSLFKISRTQNIYQAESMIEMSVRRPRIMDRDEAVLADQYSAYKATEVFNTRLNKFRSDEARLAAIDVLTSKGVKNADMISGAAFSLVPESFLVRISCMHTNPEWATLSANAYAEASVAIMEKENKELSESAVAWLNEQAIAQQKTLEDIENKLTEFRKQHNMDLLQHKKQMIEETIRALNEQRSSIQNRLLIEENVHQILINKNIPDKYAASDNLVKLIMQLRDSQSDYLHLLTKFRKEHPQAIALAKKIDSLQEALSEAFEKQQASSRKTIAQYFQQIEEVNLQIEKLQNKGSHLENEIVELNSKLIAIERERKVADMSYQGILRRIEEARFSADEKTAAVRVSSLAKTPVVPVYPRKKKILTSGFILGCLLGLGLAFSKDWLDDYITSVEDIEHGFGLKVISIIPRQKSKTRQELALASVNSIDKHQVFTEAFVGLRTSLTVGSYADVSKTLLITSAGVECGKTVTSCNLAAAYASAGTKTLLIDFDFRRPRLSRIFSLSTLPENSLLHVLNRSNQLTDSDYEKLVSKTENEHLYVISNYVDRNIKASSLLGKKSLSRFMNWATANFEQIILDSPPHSLLSDAAALSAYVDGVLLVCRHQKTHKRALRNAVRHLRHVDANILGVVINATPIRKGPFSNYDYYYGGYSVEEYIGSTSKDDDVS